MQTLVYEYENKQIEFLLSGDMIVNATEIASVYDKRVYEFTRREETKEFINKLSKRSIGDFKDGDFPYLKSKFKDLDEKNIIKSVNGVPILITIPGREGATWMHRWVAIDFAMWLDMDFKIWIIEKIDYLLINFSNKQMELLNKKQELIKRRDEIIERNQTNPDVLELNQIIDDIRGISQKLGQTTKSQYLIWNNL